MRKDPVAVRPPDDDAMESVRGPAETGPRNWLSHATEPHILYPAIAALALAGIWGTTLNLVTEERATAERRAASLARELTETYEAHVLRAIHEIDKTLKVVKYAHELRGPKQALEELKMRALLPPTMLFTVAIADGKGEIVASNRPMVMTNVADRSYFKGVRESDDLVIGLPQQSPGAGAWTVQFGRRLDAIDDSFSGIAMVSVDSAFFVSSYELSRLGERGFLGILGADGVFRAGRIGETVTAGETADYASIVPRSEAEEVEATVSTNPWDGVRRYTSAGQLYDYPLAVIVGLSEDDQMASVQRAVRLHLWLAAGASVLLLLVVAALGRMSLQLKQSRQLAVKEHIAYAARAEHRANHDGLTALPNRSLFSALLKRSISQAGRYDRRLAVLFLDLDRFKYINDTLGHDAGDELLKEVARRLEGCVRESDTVARLGGDEFVVLMPELDDESAAAQVARKVLAAIARPYSVAGHEFCVTASVGICIYPRDGLDEQALTMNADIAMYQAKKEGKNRFQFHSGELSATLLERFSLESDLRVAISRGELELHYQPKRNIRADRITGMEALLRWNHPGLGVVAPMRFIPIAEESGLMVAIGKWAIRTACAQNVAWQEQGLPRLGIAINLTSRQFSDEHLLADLKEVLAETGMDAELLELEFSESLLMRDVAGAMRTLSELRDMGVRIAIDDFGIAYSSLTSLRRFPLDSIKIDRSFIRDIVSVAEGRELAKAVISMGRSLSLNIVAQGVETREQAEFLRDNACVEFLGFYLGRPVPAGQMVDLLRQQAGAEPAEPKAVHDA
jgi:diguanylate cyclase (GGDEF)-like protein